VTDRDGLQRRTGTDRDGQTLLVYTNTVDFQLASLLVSPVVGGGSIT
jgi:hypothetical protein